MLCGNYNSPLCDQQTSLSARRASLTVGITKHLNAMEINFSSSQTVLCGTLVTGTRRFDIITGHPPTQVHPAVNPPPVPVLQPPLHSISHLSLTKGPLYKRPQVLKSKIYYIFKSE